MPRIEFNPLPETGAARFFRSKGFKVGFDWRDVFAEENARMFTVASRV